MCPQTWNREHTMKKLDIHIDIHNISLPQTPSPPVLEDAEILHENYTLKKDECISMHMFTYCSL